MKDKPGYTTEKAPTLIIGSFIVNPAMTHLASTAKDDLFGLLLGTPIAGAKNCVRPLLLKMLMRMV